MKPLKLLGRVAITLVFVLAAAWVGHGLWDHYIDAPWTRDGKVRADVVGVAPDVSGLVSEVFVKDNQVVKKGDVLFRIDPARFKIALAEAQATLDSASAALDQTKRETARVNRLGDAASEQQKEEAQTDEDKATATYQASVAARDLAALNLARTDVKAAVSGTVTNVTLRPGNYVTTGTAEMALIDDSTLRVEGYFEENKLPRIHIGDKVTVRLMGEPTPLQGHVESIATGIVDRERTSGSLLANITPTFSWVRLAQRVPVRIHIDYVPDGSRLIAGLTATVEVGDSAANLLALRD